MYAPHLSLIKWYIYIRHVVAAQHRILIGGGNETIYLLRFDIFRSPTTVRTAITVEWAASPARQGALGYLYMLSYGTRCIHRYIASVRTCDIVCDATHCTQSHQHVQQS